MNALEKLGYVKQPQGRAQGLNYNEYFSEDKLKRIILFEDNSICKQYRHRQGDFTWVTDRITQAELKVIFELMEE